MKHLVIIGNGVAGITTARHVRKRSDCRITVISDETDHFFSRTALMYIYMGHMKFEHTKPYEDWFWAKNRIELIRDHVTRVDTASQQVHLAGGKSLRYDQLVIATGSQSNKFGWPGQDLPGVQGLYSYGDLQLLEENTRGIRHGVIVGGGLIGIELAEMLLSRKIAVTFLVREDYYWDNILPMEDARLISRHVREHGIDLRLKTNLKAILPGPDGRVRAVVTEHNEEIPTPFVGLTPGVHPNIELAKASNIPTNRGVLVNEFLETEIPNVYACGDCVEIRAEDGGRNRIEQLWYTGRMQAEALARTLCGQRTRYDRGIWFNSAKFLDIEYQTYGFVSNLPREGEKTFYWEHPDGRHSVRIVYREENEAVVGFNFFGIRMRQDVCQAWIGEQKTLQYVLPRLHEANFDPEFFKRYELQILAEYNAGSTRQLKPVRKLSLFGQSRR